MVSVIVLTIIKENVMVMVYSRVQSLFICLIAGLMFLFISCTVYASGFGIFTQDAAALGKGNAQVAHTDNPSAIFFNPGLLTRLEGTHVRLGTTLLFPERRFTSDLDGSRYSTRSQTFFPSTFYFSHKTDQNVALGFGFFSPFGLGTDWGRTWEGRYLATRSEMHTYNLNPSIAFQLTDWLSIGGGFNLLFLDTTLERNVLIDPALPDGRMKFDGDGDGVGFNIGVLIDLPHDFSLGVSYRSEISVDVDGDLTFSVPDPAAPLFPDSRASTDFDLPRIVHAAISYTGFERTTFEVGLRWEGWSSFKSLELRSPLLDIDEEKRWKDTWAFNIGIEYQPSDMWILRAGYLYGQTPVPDKTFEPAIPDADAHLFTLGAGIRRSNFSFDLAYGYQLMEKRNKDNRIGEEFGLPANGRYESEIHMVGVSMGYKF